VLQLNVNKNVGFVKLVVLLSNLSSLQRPSVIKPYILSTLTVSTHLITWGWSHQLPVTTTTTTNNNNNKLNGVLKVMGQSPT